MRKIDHFRRVVFFLFFSLVITSSLEAATLTISPTKIRLSILPGSSKTGTIRLENSSEDYLEVKAYLEDWEYDLTQDGTKNFYPAGTSKFSCAPWINFAPAQFSIPPFGRQLVGYTVEVPDGASGGHYAVLFFETKMGEQPRPGTTKEEGVTVTVLGRVGTLFYIEPEGTIKREVDVSNFELKRKSNASPLEVMLYLENNGNVDIEAGGSFHLMDKQGLIYARGEFNDIFTFPANKAKLSAIWKNPIPQGRYDLVVTLDLGKAWEKLGTSRGPILVKEAVIEIGDNGEVIEVGKLE